jgi:hypothetical protein
MGSDAGQGAAGKKQGGLAAAAIDGCAAGGHGIPWAG